MNSKKILAMIVAVAMVVAIVPAFTLTAGATENEFTHPDEIKPWGTQQSTLTFGPYVGTVKIGFDVEYNFGETKPLGNHYLGFSTKAWPRNNPTFGGSIIAMQGYAAEDPNHGKISFTDGSSGRQALFTPVDGQPYHVEITADTNARKYNAILSGGNLEEELTVTDAAFRASNIGAIDTFMLFYNGGEAKENDWCKVTNLTINGDAPVSYETEKIKFTDKNGIQWQKAGINEGASEPNIIFNGAFDYGTAGWSNGDGGVMLESDGFKIGDKEGHNNALNDSSSPGGNDGSAKPTAIGGKWSVTGGKNYVLTFDILKENAGHHNGGIFFFDANGNKLTLNADLCLSDNIHLTTNNAKDGLCETGDFLFNDFVANTWVTKEYMVKAPDNAAYIGLQNAWSGDTWIDNVSLYELERIATEVTVKFQTASGEKAGEDETITGYVGDTFTYDVKANNMKKYNGKTFIYKEGNSGIVLKEDKAANVVTLTYEEDTPQTLVNELNFTTRVKVGVSDKLPVKVDMKGTGENVFTGLDVEWEEEKVAQTADDYTITGTLKDFPDIKITANVTVKASVDELRIVDFTFDDNKTDIATDTSGNSYNGTIVGDTVTCEEGIIKLPGEAKDKGYIQLSNEATDDIIKAADAGGFTVSAVMKKEKVQNSFFYTIFSPPSNGHAQDDSFAMIEGSKNGNNNYSAFRFAGRPKTTSSTVSLNATKVREENDADFVKLTMTVDYNAAGEGKVKLYINGEDVSQDPNFTINFRPSDVKIGGDRLYSYIGLSPWNQYDNCWGGQIDQFTVYSVALTPEEVAEGTEAIKVDYQINGETVKSVEDRIVSGRTMSLPTMLLAKGGKYYSADAFTTSASVTKPMDLVEKMGEISDYVAPTTVFSYDFAGKSATKTEPAGGFNIQRWSPELVIHTYEVPVPQGKALSSAKLHINSVRSDNDSNRYNSEVYAISSNNLIESLDDFKDAEFAGGDTSNNWKEVTGAVKVASEAFKPSSGMHEVTLDNLSDFTYIDGKLVLMVYESTAGNRWYSNGVGNISTSPYLTDITFIDATPADPKIVLGWDTTGKLFTANVKAETPAEKIVIKGQNAEIADQFDEMESGTIEGTEAIIAPGADNTNRIYSVTAKNGNAESGAVKTSIYALVAQAISEYDNETALNEDQLTAAVDVLNNGGIYIDGTTKKLNAEADLIMDLNAEHGTITLNATAKQAGLEFVEGTVKCSVGEEEKTVTVTKDTITIEDGLETQSFDMIVLEEIEFAFEPDEVAEVADEAGTVDFVEEI